MSFFNRFCLIIAVISVPLICMLHSFPPTVVCPSFTAIVTSYPGVNTEENADVDVILPSII